jgi:hypothetical protein
MAAARIVGGQLVGFKTVAPRSRPSGRRTHTSWVRTGGVGCPRQLGETRQQSADGGVVGLDAGSVVPEVGRARAHDVDGEMQVLPLDEGEQFVEVRSGKRRHDCVELHPQVVATGRVDRRLHRGEHPLATHGVIGWSGRVEAEDQRVDAAQDVNAPRDEQTVRHHDAAHAAALGMRDQRAQVGAQERLPAENRSGDTQVGELIEDRAPPVGRSSACCAAETCNRRSAGCSAGSHRSPHPPARVGRAAGR